MSWLESDWYIKYELPEFGTLRHSHITCGDTRRRLYITNLPNKTGVVAWCHNCQKRGYFSTPIRSLGNTKGYYYIEESGGKSPVLTLESVETIINDAKAATNYDIISALRVNDSFLNYKDFNEFLQMCGIYVRPHKHEYSSYRYSLIWRDVKDNVSFVTNVTRCVKTKEKTAVSYRIARTTPPTTLSVVVSGNLDTSIKSDTCVVVEDRVSAACAARCSHELKTITKKMDFISLHGSYISPRDVAFISKRYKNIIIAFDNDTSENIETARKYRELFVFMGNNSVFYHKSPEFKKQSVENLVDAITYLSKLWPIENFK